VIAACFFDAVFVYPRVSSAQVFTVTVAVVLLCVVVIVTVVVADKDSVVDVSDAVVVALAGIKFAQQRML
jgi:hypothetical protein